MNKNHPEIRPGEMWLTNMMDLEYHMISYKTKRIGRVAYAKSGYVIQGVFPVFVQKSEYDGIMKVIEKRKRDDRIRYKSN